MNPIDAVTPVSNPNTELEPTFKRVVGNVFYGQLLKSMRQGAGKPAYIHGGQAEDLFQSQLDQVLVEKLSGHEGGPWMDELFQQFLTQLNQRAGVATPAQPVQLAQPEQSEAPASLSQLAKAARQTQPAPQDAGIKSGTAALSALIRK
jgi:Rod binding domain-containing protein